MNDELITVAVVERGCNSDHFDIEPYALVGVSPVYLYSKFRPAYAQLTVINSWFPEQFSFGIIVFVDEDVALN